MRSPVAAGGLGMREEKEKGAAGGRKKKGEGAGACTHHVNDEVRYLVLCVSEYTSRLLFSRLSVVTRTDLRARSERLLISTLLSRRNAYNVLACFWRGLARRYIRSRANTPSLGLPSLLKCTAVLLADSRVREETLFLLPFLSNSSAVVFFSPFFTMN